MTTPFRFTVLMAALLVGAPAAYARQDTGSPPTELRVEAEPQEAPRGDGFVDKMRRVAEDWQIAERLNGDVDGWYPRLGGMTTGSGFAFGPGFRTHVTDRRILVDVSAAMSYKMYKAFDAKVEWLQSRVPNAELWTNFRYQDFPQEDFFGFGNATRLDARTNYALKSTDVTALGIYHLRRWLRVGTELGYFQPEIGRGTDKDYPSTALRFTEADAPGLTAQPDFLHTTFFTEVDYRDARDNAKSGGFYKLQYGVWDDRGLEQFDFRRLDAEAAQFVPLVASKTHVIASRVAVSYVNNASGEHVPFFFVPYVGGGRTVRSYEEFRFQDENAFWWNTEYRWLPHKRIQIAPFFDLGNVHRDWASLFDGDMKTGYGIGFRVVSSKRVFARFDIGLGGNEGRQYLFKLSESF
jgi:hypothetical protein